MSTILILLSIIAVPSQETSPGLDTPQIGLNFIRLFWPDRATGDLDTTTPFFQPDWIFADFGALGIDAFRQLTRADLLWADIEPQNDQ